MFAEMPLDIPTVNTFDGFAATFWPSRAAGSTAAPAKRSNISS
jgi:hypothetical protein